MNKIIIIPLILLLFFSCNIIPPGNNSKKTPHYNKSITLLINTTKGDIKVILKNEYAPEVITEISKLVQKGFYNGMPFYRIIKDKFPYIVQTGDPMAFSDIGRAGFFSGPIENGIVLNGVDHCYGCVALAADPISKKLSTQFYFLLNHASFLNGKDTVIGEVVEGMKTVMSLTEKDKITEMKIIPR